MNTKYPRIITVLFVFCISITQAYSQTDGEINPHTKDSILFWQEKNIDSAIYFAQQYFNTSKVEKKRDEIFEIGEILADYLYKEGNYSEEIVVLTELLDYCKGDELQLKKADILLKLGEALRAVKQYEVGLEYLSEAEKIFKVKNKLEKLAKTYNRKAAILYQKNTSLGHEIADYTQTFAYIDKSIEIAENFSNIEIISSGLEIKGAYYRASKDYKKAIKTFFKVINIYKKNNRTIFPNLYINISLTFFELKDYEKSIYYGEKAYSLLTKKTEYSQQITYITRYLSYSYNELKDYKNAYTYVRIYENSSNKQWNIEKEALMEEMSRKYLIEKKERQLEKQKEANKYNQLKISQKQNTNYLLGGFVAVAVLVLLIMLRQKHKVKQTNQKLEFTNREIESKKKALVQKNRQLEKLGEFKSSVSAMLVHDLKNPLNFIMANSQHDKKNKSNIHIYVAASKMLAHILNILDVNKYENTSMMLKTEKFEIQQLVNAVYNETKHGLDVKNIRFQTNIPENYTLNADKSIIERVLMNIVSNAIKYTPVGGKITISASPKNADFINISVADTGDGIPENMKEYIFEKYTSIDSKYKANSSGLGLAFCKIAVETHGGQIQILQEIGTGAEFVFSIPYLPEGARTKTITGKWVKTNEKVENIVLSDSEKLLIEPYIAKLIELDVYCISDVKKITKEIHSLNSNNCQEIAVRINCAVANCSQTMFESAVANAV